MDWKYAVQWTVQEQITPDIPRPLGKTVVPRATSMQTSKMHDVATGRTMGNRQMKRKTQHRLRVNSTSDEDTDTYEDQELLQLCARIATEQI